MKNAFSRIGRTCAFFAVAGGLMAGSLLAGSGEVISVTLPHAVTVGSSTLPAGQYKMSSLDMADGEPLFVVRSQSGQVVTLQAQRIQAPATPERSQVLFTADGDKWHFDKLYLQGDSEGYEFFSGK